MKKFLFLLLFPIIAQAQTWTTVYGTIYDGLGRAYAKQPVLVVKTIKNGTPLVSSIPQTVLTDANGYVSWLSPRTAPGDTVVIYVYAQVPAYSKFGGAGVPLIIPNAETAELSTLVAPVTVPNSYPILVSGGFVSGAVLSDSLDANPRVPDVSGIISDSLDSNPRIPDVSGLISDSLDANPRVPNVAQSIMDSIQGNVFSGLQKIPWSKIDPTGIVIDTAGTTNRPEITNIEHMLGQFTSSTSDSLQQAQADAKLALNIGQGKAGADSVHTVLVALSNLIAGKGGADSIHTALVTLYNLVAGKPGADSVHAAIDAMLRKADTTALHAQRFAIINDSLFAISLRATSTANDLTAHASTADAHLPSQTGASGKFLQSNGTVSSWQTALTAETDPTAIPRTDSTRFVSRTAPQIPGLASADTNTVIGVDASGNLVLRKDDAGTGGSSIDSNRIVRHDIKAPKVAATLGQIDSIRLGTYVADSTVYWEADSVLWRVVGLRMPKFNRYAAAAYKHGYIELEVIQPFRGGANAFMIVADSANGVAGMTGIAEGANMAAADVSHTVSYAFNLSNSVGLQSATFATAGNCATNCTRIALNGTATKSFKIYGYSGCFNAYYIWRIRVYFAMPISSTSQYFVKIAPTL